MKLNLKALALAGGIIWGAAVFLFGLWAMMYPPAASVVAFMGDFYLGYAASFAGSVIGLMWGFADMAIGALIFGWLYNLLAGKFTAA